MERRARAQGGSPWQPWAAPGDAPARRLPAGHARWRGRARGPRPRGDPGAPRASPTCSPAPAPSPCPSPNRPRSMPSRRRRHAGRLQKGWRGAPGLHRVTTEARDLFRRPAPAGRAPRFDAAVIDPPRAGAEAQVRELARPGCRPSPMCPATPPASRATPGPSGRRLPHGPDHRRGPVPLVAACGACDTISSRLTIPDSRGARTCARLPSNGVRPDRRQ
jgi:hypothetical protein